MHVSELIGPTLDYWVARAEGYEYLDVPPDADGKNAGRALVPPGLMEGGWKFPPKGAVGNMVLPYSTDWERGGPIIERENIQLGPPTQKVHRNGGPHAGWGSSGIWSACTWHKGANGRRAIAHHESSPLIAAMRCYVVSKFGESVEDQPA